MLKFIILANNCIQEIRDFEFKIPERLYWSHRSSKEKEELFARALRACPSDWSIDTYFSSQNSFFKKGKNYYARTTIRRWITMKEKRRSR